ncbi:MAG: peptidase U34 [Candidatus Lokiarchaeota archaeon]|nr:peptidase U34 [Candidatus Lokiarchaeota archaeon]MBD3200203.1 peptidase U34 [Candidatus Lokiarchaeota archaeon]
MIWNQSKIMCDTIVALGNSTKDGSVLFGKNSDREPNEAHNILYLPRKQHASDSEIECTYIKIPQVEETFEILLLKPWWMWGCEMGSNEFGVTIGNEAVWSKEPYRDNGLLGMDLMRLALERSENAKKALEIIIELLSKYGQGGACGYTDKKLKYHNSFIIADPTEAWVLETADKFWIAEKVRDIRSISNTLTIGKEYDLIHPELINHAIKKGYCDTEHDFNFAECFIPRFNIKQIGAKGNVRKECTMNRLKQLKGKITPQFLMEILRNHNIKLSEKDHWDPSKGSMKSPCMHYTSFITPSQSTGSHIAHLKKDIQVHWVTGTSAPCTSLYKPFFFPNGGLQLNQEVSEKHYNHNSLWWRHEKLHRLILMDYQKRLNMIRPERNKLEARFHKDVKDVISGNKENEQEKMHQIATEAFNISFKKIDEWINQIKDLDIENKPNYFYRRRWKKLNKFDQLIIN